jgi:hypothetical protein
MSGIKNTLQFGDSKGNIFHKENLGTHVTGDSLTEIPPSTTSSSGNYHFKSEGMLQIANFSGDQTGGVEIWNGSDAEPPKKLLSIKRDGITCEKIITTDGTNSAVLSTNLTFNDIPYTRNMVNSSLIYSSEFIYRDSTYPPATNLFVRNTFGYSGWAFINTALESKFNYYFSPQSDNTTVTDIKGVTFNYFNETQTSGDYQIICTIYTMPQDGDVFYHSKRNYVFDKTIIPTINTAYQACVLVDKSLVSYYSEIQIQYELDPLNQVGPFLPDEKILAVTLSSDGSCPPSTMSIVLSKICIIMDNFTKESNLISP